MNKKCGLILVSMLALSGCATNAPTKQVTLYDGSHGFSTRCSGTASDWTGCYETAKNTCPNGFVNKGKEYIDFHGYLVRVFQFKCKGV